MRRETLKTLQTSVIDMKLQKDVEVITSVLRFCRYTPPSHSKSQTFFIEFENNFHYSGPLLEDDPAAGFTRKKRHEKVAVLVEDIADVSLAWVDDTSQWAVCLTVKGSDIDMAWWYKEEQEYEANELYIEILNFKLDPTRCGEEE